MSKRLEIGAQADTCASWGSLFMALRGSIAQVQSHPSGVIGIVTPGGGLMKSEALKRVRNPGIGTYSEPEPRGDRC
jgi:hypothetical protein